MERAHAPVLDKGELDSNMKVVLASNLDRHLQNGRMPLARRLKERGIEVVLVCPEGPYAELIREAGFRVAVWPLMRKSLNPLQEFMALVRLARLYRRERPDVVHHFTIKPNIYGTIAARFTGTGAVINTWTGLGFVFSGVRIGSAVRMFLSPVFRTALRGRLTWNVFQNESDRDVFIDSHYISKNRSIVIPGAGVDLDRFAPSERSENTPPIVLVAARLLRDKGIAEFVEAARLLREQGIVARFWVAGTRDPGNPACIPQRTIDEWKRDGLVEFLGYLDDMPKLLRETDIAVLPSYHEGVPRFLLEAAASGLPLVATEIPGNTTVALHDVNARLVPIKSAHALATAISALATDPALRTRYGRASRTLAETNFGDERIVEQYLDVYRRLPVAKQALADS
jgi:glycosyltransferase involved in cell wall biosynthesis